MTAADHTRYAEWDAAYVLGALSRSERLEFEDHLDTCEKCRAAVAELSGLPGLLGRLDHARAYALAEPDADAVAGRDVAVLVAVDREPDLDHAEAEHSRGLVTRIRARERAQKLRRRVGIAAGLAAAAVLASVLTIVVPPLVSPPPEPLVSAQLVPVADSSPIVATVALTPVGWGTRIDLECSYHPDASAYGPVEYSMWVVGRDGSEQAVSSWMAAPSSTVKLASGTALAVGDIADVQLRSADGTQTLLDAELPVG
jgi:Putative zinc-finger